MKSIAICLGVLVAGICFAVPVDQADAALTSAQRRELSKIRKDVSRASSLIRRKKLGEAEKLLDEADKRLEKLAKAAKLKTNDKSLAPTKTSIARQRQVLKLRKSGKKGSPKDSDIPVSFTKQVAPILRARCLNCHNNRASGRLRLDTFAGMKRGGRSGPLLSVGNAKKSLIVRRLIAPANQRMPQKRAALPSKEIQTIARWITQGAKFDGDNENTPLASLKAGDPASPKKKPVPVVIAKATGKEKVSFVKDIAPTFVNLCTRCHGGRNPRADFSLVTFESLMKGGESGRVLIAGNLEGSRLFRLVGALELPRMPQGQARITRKFYNDLQTWINEGLKYDGGDPKKRLRDLVPTDEELKAERFAKLSPEEFAQFREDRTDEQWQRVLRKEPARFVRSKEFFIYGNASAERLQQMAEWAEDHAKSLRSVFGVKDNLIWKGRLTVFVYKDRFGYTEFNQVIHDRDTAAEVTGHSVVTPSFEDAYIVLQDIGDEAGSDTPGLKINLIDHLTGAFLKRAGRNMPDWVSRGTGLALAARKSSGNAYIQGLRGAAIEALRGLEKPEDVFASGKFSPTQIGPVGYSLVDFMLKAGGTPKFGRFIRSLQSGSNVAAAVKAAYPPADLKALGTAYLRSLSKKGK